MSPPKLTNASPRIPFVYRVPAHDSWDELDEPAQSMPTSDVRTLQQNVPGTTVLSLGGNDGHAPPGTLLGNMSQPAPAASQPVVSQPAPAASQSLEFVPGSAAHDENVCRLPPVIVMPVAGIVLSERQGVWAEAAPDPVVAVGPVAASEPASATVAAVDPAVAATEPAPCRACPVNADGPVAEPKARPVRTPRRTTAVLATEGNSHQKARVNGDSESWTFAARKELTGRDWWSADPQQPSGDWYLICLLLHRVNRVSFRYEDSFPPDGQLERLPYEGAWEQGPQVALCESEPIGDSEYGMANGDSKYTYIYKYLLIYCLYTHM